MIKYSTVYRNQITVIPKEIKLKSVTQKNIIQWIIDKKTKEISVKFISKNDMNNNNINQIIKNEEFIYIFRNISEKRHIVLPVEVEKVLEFDYRKHLIKWNIKNNKILIDKLVKIDFMNISGILNKENMVKE